MKFTSLTALLVLSASCAQGVPGTPDDLNAADPAAATTRVHIMPLRTPEAQALRQSKLNNGAATAKLTYYGGPVLQNVKVQIVYWGGAAKVAGAGQLEGFYTAITKSAHIDWLSEYNTSSPTQQIGRGSFLGSTDATGAKIGKITDADIQTQITSLIGGGKVPTSDFANTLYMVHFPPGMSISQGGSTSCTQFCAYHGTFTLGGHNVYYGVIPDQNADGCQSGCGGGTAFENTTSTTSHELIEAVTDPAVGLATTSGPPLAWYDQTNGEIGDICVTGSGYTGVVAGYTVQKEWSNKNKSCIVTDGGTTPPPPPPPANDFGLTLGSSSATVAAGGTTTVQVLTTKTGSAETVSLAVSGLPRNVTGSFSPATVSSGGSATLTLSAAASASAASGVAFTVTGTATSGSHSASGALSVTTTTPPPPPPPTTADFSVALSSSAATVKAGASTTLTVTTAIVSGSPGKLALSVSGLPADVSFSFSPASVSAGGSSTLTLSAAATAATSSAKLTVTAADGTNSHSAPADLTVIGATPPPPPPPGGGNVVNGDFEGGATGWQRSGNSLITTKAYHDGGHSALVGTSGSFYGDSALYQKVAVPASGTTTLSFWHLMRCRDASFGSYVAAYVADEGGTILDTIFETCDTDNDWTQANTDLSAYAGTNVYVYFYAYDVGFRDFAAWLYVDGISATTR